ncbi:MAG: ester cyclase [Leptospiraceae bacterium]|nr:ester cyclase [Leptospiraceae bacterium]
METDGPAEDLEKHKDLLRRFVRAINEEDWRGLRNVLHPDFRRHSHAAGEAAIEEGEDLVQFFRAQRQVFPDGQETIQDILAEGDRVAVRHSFNGTQAGALGPFPASGKKLSSEYIAIYRIQDDRIAECWAEWDNLSALEQLGHSAVDPQ